MTDFFITMFMLQPHLVPRTHNRRGGRSTWNGGGGGTGAKQMSHNASTECSLE
jgi:hypothetical protein